MIDGRYIVVYERSAESVRAETDAREDELGFESDFRYRHALKGFAGSLNRDQVRALRRDPDVAYVTPDRTVHASSLVPVMPGDVVPTGPRRIGAATASAVEEASDIGVAVLDSGVDLTHPDLNVVHGTNCITPGASSDDDNGHGTHVAGSIAAKNNGSGVTGVAPGTKLWAVKVLDSNGDGSFSKIACGLDWVAANAATHNIKVANMSLGGAGDPVRPCSTTGDPMHRAVCRLVAADVLTVAAAGNDGRNFDHGPVPDVPAAYPEALTVTALSDSDGLPGGTGGAPACEPFETDDYPATFSNFAATAAGATHTIAAPGVCITSTWPTDLASSGYAVASGTSMAAPHMSGVAALCENHAGRPGICAGKTPAEVISTLRASAQSNTLAQPAYGFTLDPSHGPIPNLFFGYLTGVFDTQPPDTTITSGPSGTVKESSPSFEFSATEAGSSFECSLDDGAWTPCSSPQTVPNVSEGNHTLWVRAVDVHGNVDASPAARTWSTDTTPPDTSIGSGPSGETISTSARFEFAASEAGSKLACKLDKGEWAICASPMKVTGLSEGTHTLLVAAIDPAGNVDPSPAARDWTVLPSTARVASRLAANLRPLARALRRAGIEKLVKRGAFRATRIEALLAGRVTITLKGTTVLAKGSRSVARPGRYALKVKLTRRGRRALKGEERSKVSLVIRFRDGFGRRTSRSKTVKLRG